MLISLFLSTLERKEGKWMVQEIQLTIFTWQQSKIKKIDLLLLCKFLNLITIFVLLIFYMLVVLLNPVMFILLFIFSFLSSWGIIRRNIAASVYITSAAQPCCQYICEWHDHPLLCFLFYIHANFNYKLIILLIIQYYKYKILII